MLFTALTSTNVRTTRDEWHRITLGHRGRWYSNCKFLLAVKSSTWISLLKIFIIHYLRLILHHHHHRHLHLIFLFFHLNPRLLLSFNRPMSTYPPMPLDSSHHHQQIRVTQRTYGQTTRTTTTTNRSFQSYSSLVPIPSVDLCENLLYDVHVVDEGGSATSSSYVNSTDHYDNTCINTYDNPIGYLENVRGDSPLSNIVFCSSLFHQYPPHSALINFPYDNHSEFYQQTLEKSLTKSPEKRSSPRLSRTSSPVLVYLENKNLALCASITCLVLLLLVGLGIFLFDKLSQPIIVDEPLPPLNNSHANLLVVSPPSTLPPSPSSPVNLFDQISTELRTTTPPASSTFDYTTCPKDSWGPRCEKACKPCGLGYCDPKTGECICPADIYGEFCDLWKGNSLKMDEKSMFPLVFLQSTINHGAAIWNVDIALSLSFSSMNESNVAFSDFPSSTAFFTLSNPLTSWTWRRHQCNTDVWSEINWYVWSWTHLDSSIPCFLFSVNGEYDEKEEESNAPSSMWSIDDERWWWWWERGEWEKRERRRR